MKGIVSRWVVEPSVPKAIRGDYAVVAAEHVRAQEPLLYTGFSLGVPGAVVLGKSLPGYFNFVLLVAILLACVLGAVLRRRAPVTENEAIRALTISTIITATIIALGAAWAISAWRVSPESYRLAYPFFMTIGVIVAAYAYAKVRRLAAICLAIGLGPLALFMLAEGTMVEKACATGIVIAGTFMVAMARNNRQFVVELLEKRRALHHLSRCDSLTGLPNRRAFLEDAYRMGAKADHLRLILLDLDRFKAINDTYGHEMGDRVLCDVSRIIEDFAVQGVSAARVGGEEFALIGSIEDLSAVAGLHLLTTLRQAEMPHGTRVTASIGMATAPLKSDDDWKVLYSLADRALYEAKAEGRDCAVAGSSDAPTDPAVAGEGQARDHRAA